MRLGDLPVNAEFRFKVEGLREGLSLTGRVIEHLPSGTRIEELGGSVQRISGKWVARRPVRSIWSDETEVIAL